MVTSRHFAGYPRYRQAVATLMAPSRALASRRLLKHAMLSTRIERVPHQPTSWVGFKARNMYGQPDSEHLLGLISQEIAG
jgi:hypothetical protein